jgi:hypothetical protein
MKAITVMLHTNTENDEKCDENTKTPKQLKQFK